MWLCGILLLFTSLIFSPHSWMWLMLSSVAIFLQNKMEYGRAALVVNIRELPIPVVSTRLATMTLTHKDVFRRFCKLSRPRWLNSRSKGFLALSSTYNFYNLICNSIIPIKITTRNVQKCKKLTMLE